MLWRDLLPNSGRQAGPETRQAECRVARDTASNRHTDRHRASAQRSGAMAQVTARSAPGRGTAGRRRSPRPRGRARWRCRCVRSRAGDVDAERDVADRHARRHARAAALAERVAARTVDHRHGGVGEVGAEHAVCGRIERQLIRRAPGRRRRPRPPAAALIQPVADARVDHRHAAAVPRRSPSWRCTACASRGRPPARRPGADVAIVPTSSRAVQDRDRRVEPRHVRGVRARIDRDRDRAAIERDRLRRCRAAARVGRVAVRGVEQRHAATARLAE